MLLNRIYLWIVLKVMRVVYVKKMIYFFLREKVIIKKIFVKIIFDIKIFLYDFMGLTVF